MKFNFKSFPQFFSLILFISIVLILIFPLKKDINDKSFSTNNKELKEFLHQPTNNNALEKKFQLGGGKLNKEEIETAKKLMESLVN